MNHEKTDPTLAGKLKKNLKSSELIINKAALLIVSKNAFGECFVINKHHNFIGRSDSCDIRINDNLVSGKHCEITIEEDGKYYINDLESTNSTYLNKKKLSKKVHLLYGDRIVMGNTIFRFFVEESLD
ncbi:MAG: FHA domain-containing protein [Spirochaetales bacterium]|nr:FHA domain-containing protein [Spirochaetales bacterium]